MKSKGEQSSKTSSRPEKTTGIKPRARTAEEQWYYASQGQLIWWGFKKHKVALAAAVFLGMFYLVAIFAEFFAPYDARTRSRDWVNAPPTQVHFIDAEGNLRRPFVYRVTQELNLQTFRNEFVEDTTQRYPIYFIVRGDPYRLLGLFPTNIRLMGTEGAPLLLFGADRVGRDLYSRIIYGARISLFIGLGGVFFSFVLGCLFGGISGFFGGTTDELIQRIIDVLISIPTIPLWMALAAAIPREWTVPQTYFAMTLVLAVVGWAGLARVVRGKLLSMRDEDYALAAKGAGGSDAWIIRKHLLPGFLSFLIVHLTLAIPYMILGETALSFIGLGMQPPAVSWGVLLQDAQDIAAISHRPWQLIPGLFVVLAVLLFNFVGDGLRDAADPYSK